jgi:hypothetical protein
MADKLIKSKLYLVHIIQIFLIDKHIFAIWSHFPSEKYQIFKYLK